MSRGRPPKSYKEKRTESYRLRMTKDEKIFLDAVAEHMQCDRSEIIRSALDLFYNLGLGLDTKCALLRSLNKEEQHG